MGRICHLRPFITTASIFLFRADTEPCHRKECGYCLIWNMTSHILHEFCVNCKFLTLYLNFTQDKNGIRTPCGWISVICQSFVVNCHILTSDWPGACHIYCSHIFIVGYSSSIWVTITVLRLAPATSLGRLRHIHFVPGQSLSTFQKF